MKVRFIPTLIAAGISALIAYAMYSFCKTTVADNKLILAIGGFVCMFLSLAVCIGISFDRSRTSVNISVIGSVFFTLLLISNAIFTFISCFSLPLYVIVNGILLLTMLLVTYAVAKAKQ